MKVDYIKKIIVSFILTLMIIMSICQGIVYAVAPSLSEGSIKTKLSAMRYVKKGEEYKESAWGFALNTATDHPHIIWQILKEDDQGQTTGTNLYCLNAAIGATWNEAITNKDGTDKEVEYDKNCDLSAADQVRSLMSGYANDSKITNENYKKSFADYKYYNSILWLLDNIYIPGGDVSKEEFLKKVGIEKSSNAIEIGNQNYDVYKYVGKEKRNWANDLYYYLDNDQKVHDALLPDELIESVQQAAIWYFTNYKQDENQETIQEELENEDEQHYSSDFGKYNFKTDNEATVERSMIKYIYKNKEDDNPEEYLKIEDQDEYKFLFDDACKGNDTNGKHIGKMYHEQASIIYNYLIEQAEKHNDSYTEQESLNGTIEIKRNDSHIVNNNDKYKIGPFTLNTTGNVSDIQIKVSKAGEALEEQEITEAEIQDGEGHDLESIGNGTEFYVIVPKTSIEEEGITIKATCQVNGTEKRLWVAQNTSQNQEQPLVEITPKSVEKSDEVNITIEKEFDLALRKIITKVNGKDTFYNEQGYEAVRFKNGNINIDTTSIPNTATYMHRKDPVVVNAEDIVTYQIRIYNEGEIAGYASKIVDQLPDNLELVQQDASTVTSKKQNNYTISIGEGNDITLTMSDGELEDVTSLNPYNSETKTLDYDTIELQCKVTQKADQKTHYLTNIAYIGEAKNGSGEVQSRDRGNRESQPSLHPNYTSTNLHTNSADDVYHGGNNNNGDNTRSIFNEGTNNDVYFMGREDDDDFETVVVMPKEFDLKLVKYISEVNGDSSKGRTIQSVDTSMLNKTDSSGNKITTADYQVSKVPILVQTGDYVTYTFRIYNEGDIDGYASEIAEDIPEGLEFVYDPKIQVGEDGQLDFSQTTGLSDADKEAIQYNMDRGWKTISTGLDGTTLNTRYLSKETSADNLIKAYDASKDINHDGAEGLYYKEVSIKLKVVSEDVTKIIRNEAAIVQDTDSEGQMITDRDSKTEEWNKEDSDDYYDNEDYPKYKEDDEDYDNIKLVRFDIALRKFISAISPDINIESSEYLTGTNSREPKVDTSKLKTGEETTAIYKHSKEPIVVNAGDYVLYTIRVYNEGDLDAYAAEVKDYLPTYLNYIDGQFNQSYGWVYSQVIENNVKKKVVTTDYLSAERGVILDKNSTSENNKDVHFIFDRKHNSCI